MTKKGATGDFLKNIPIFSYQTKKNVEKKNCDYFCGQPNVTESLVPSTSE